ncbi:MAG: aconitase family protein [Microthrixaceae bacterium]|nr:aconitase family protein [Microthrixaceae bacterium]
MEYFGEGAASISATGKGTICNMGAEIGATTSLFPHDDAMDRYLRSTGSDEIADAAGAIAHHLRADDEVLANPEACFDQLITIDLDTLRPTSTVPPPPPTWRGRWATSATRPASPAGRWSHQPPWSAPAPTPPTRTSPAPRRSCATPRPTASR